MALWRIAIEAKYSRLSGIVPVLVVHPLMQSVDFYRKLGFKYPQLLGDPPTIAFLERNDFILCLEEADFEVTITPSGTWDLILRVEDLDAELDALRAQEVTIKRGPTELVAGLLKRNIAEIVDPCGYVVCIEQRTWLTAAH